MKKSFSLVEIILVIVLIGIIGIGFSEIFKQIFKYYFSNKLYEELNYEANNIVDIIANRIRYSVNNTIIASNGVNFESIENSSVSKDNYNILEWISEDIYAKRGMWNNLNKIQIGFSGFIDLNNSDETNCKIYSPDSNFSIVREIANSYLQQWGINEDAFLTQREVLIFNSDFFNKDYFGYYHNQKQKVYSINSITSNTAVIAPLSGSCELNESYFISNGANAIEINENNLSFYFNYYPWRNEIYNNGTKIVLTTNLDEFNVTYNDNYLDINLCLLKENIHICVNRKVKLK